MNAPNDILLNIEDLKVNFNTEEGIVRAVNGVDLDIYKREFFALVGESGSGKTVTAMSILRLIQSPPGEIVSGKIFFQENDLLKLNENHMKTIRGKMISMIFQNPMNSLNPTLKIGKQLMRVMRVHSVNTQYENEDLVHQPHSRNTKTDFRSRSIKMLEIVGIGDAKRRIDEYPYQFSGGMQQRVMIAMALACNPMLLIADEPTTALDVTIQAQILWLLSDLQKDFKASILLITHDLSIVAQFCDRLAIMYAGKIVERGHVLEVFSKPLHPYTQGLLRVLPKMGQKGEKFFEIKGFPPDLIEIQEGCAFHHRCNKKKDLCERESPKELEISSTHKVSCFCADD